MGRGRASPCWALSRAVPVLVPRAEIAAQARPGLWHGHGTGLRGNRPGRVSAVLYRTGPVPVRWARPIWPTLARLPKGRRICRAWLGACQFESTSFRISEILVQTGVVLVIWQQLSSWHNTSVFLTNTKSKQTSACMAVQKQYSLIHFLGSIIRSLAAHALFAVCTL